MNKNCSGAIFLSKTLILHQFWAHVSLDFKIFSQKSDVFSLKYDGKPCKILKKTLSNDRCFHFRPFRSHFNENNIKSKCTLSYGQLTMKMYFLSFSVNNWSVNDLKTCINAYNRVQNPFLMLLIDENSYIKLKSRIYHQF